MFVCFLFVCFLTVMSPSRPSIKGRLTRMDRQLFHT